MMSRRIIHYQDIVITHCLLVAGKRRKKTFKTLAVQPWHLPNNTAPVLGGKRSKDIHILILVLNLRYGLNAASGNTATKYRL